MSTAKEQLEAQAFERQRLVSTYLSGDADGPPYRYGRTVLGGLVVAILVLAGALVVGLLG